MIRKYPPYKMLVILIVLIAMLSYFALDLYLRENSKLHSKNSETQYYNNIIPNQGPILNQNQQNSLNNVQDLQDAQTHVTKRLSPGAKIIMEKYFSICNHTIRQTINIPPDMVNLTEEQLKTAYKNWVIKKFSPKEVILYQTIDAKCPNHFILKEKDGFVAIYYQTPINGINLKEVTSINVQNLRAKDRDRLKNGIKIDSQKELAQVLEDLGS